MRNVDPIAAATKEDAQRLADIARRAVTAAQAAQHEGNATAAALDVLVDVDGAGEMQYVAAILAAELGRWMTAAR